MITIQALHKSFNGVGVLKGIDLEVPKGKITVIIGRSGSGKSVLLKHIVGLLKPDRGSIKVDGVDVTRLSNVEMTRFCTKFGMLFQSAALFDSLNVFDNVAFPLREHSDLPESKVNLKVREKLELVGLSGADLKMPSELSGGMKKRVGLARAIILEPEVLIYDEPTTGLDPIMTDAIDNLILNMQQRLGITSVVISHDVSSTMKVADQIAMIHDGQIIEVGSPRQIQQSQNKVVREFLKGWATT
jgi:phospholipid/cholesterol/gamma-HCH transport system ATP-binding protein